MILQSYPDTETSYGLWIRPERLLNSSILLRLGWDVTVVRLSGHFNTQKGRLSVKGKLHLKWFSGPNAHWRSSYSQSNSLQQDAVWVWGAGSVLIHYGQCCCKRCVIDQWYTDSSLEGINSLKVFACKPLRRKELISLTLEITQKGSSTSRLKGQVEKLKQLIL